MTEEAKIEPELTIEGMKAEAKMKPPTCPAECKTTADHAHCRVCADPVTAKDVKPGESGEVCPRMSCRAVAYAHELARRKDLIDEGNRIIETMREDRDKARVIATKVFEVVMATAPKHVKKAMMEIITGLVESVEGKPEPVPEVKVEPVAAEKPAA